MNGKTPLHTDWGLPYDPVENMRENIAAMVRVALRPKPVDRARRLRMISWRRKL